MLDQILAYLRNWFPCLTLQGTFEIDEGSLLLPSSVEIKEDQYIRVIGSVFSDGLHLWPAKFNHDEVFDGAIWLLAVPPQLLELASEIEEWTAANAQALNGPFQSESFGGYSYTKKNAAGVDGGSYSWENQFASRLARWRKI